MKTEITGLAAALMAAALGTANADEIPKAETGAPLILPGGLLEPLPKPPFSSLLSEDVFSNQGAVLPQPAAVTPPAPVAGTEAAAPLRDLLSVLDQTPIYMGKVIGTDVAYLRYNDPAGVNLNGSSIKNAFFDSGAQAVCIQGDAERVLYSQEIVPYVCRNVLDLSAEFVKGLTEVEHKGFLPFAFYDRDIYATGSIDTFKVGEGAPAPVNGNLHKTRWDPANGEIVYTLVQFSRNKRNVLEQEVARQPLNSSAYVSKFLVDRRLSGPAL